MSRFIGILALAGLFASCGCEQKPADRASGKVTSADVRRDAGEAVTTAAEFSEQTKDEFQKRLQARLETLDGEIAGARREGTRPEGRGKGQLGPDAGRLGKETGRSPRQVGRGRPVERKSLEGRPTGSAVGLGRFGESLSGRVAQLVIDALIRERTLEKKPSSS